MLQNYGPMKQADMPL